MPFIETADKTTLFYNDWGAGNPVVLIHGWPLNADMWEYQSVFLASQGMRAIAYDRRGFGRSAQPSGGYDYDTLADDLKALLDALDLRDVTLVGFSMGGGEVTRYMRRHAGGRVARTVLVSAVTPYLMKADSNPGGVEPDVFDEMTEGLLADRPYFFTGFGKQFFGVGMLNLSVTSEMLQWTHGMAMMASPRASLACVRAFSETDFRPDLAAFRVPTLLIHGTDDAIVPIDQSTRMAAPLISGATLIEYDGAPHALFITEKDRLNRDLLDFAKG